MRILFSTTAGLGHFGPLIPFASACRRAGHEVRVAAPGSFADAVRREGFEFAPLGERTDEDAASLFARLRTATFEDGNRLMLGEGAVMYARAATPGFLALVNSWRPDLIVRESGELASAVMAALGVPALVESRYAAWLRASNSTERSAEMKSGDLDGSNRQ